MKLDKSNNEKVIGTLHGNNHSVLVVVGKNAEVLKVNLSKQNVGSSKLNCTPDTVCEGCVVEAIEGKVTYLLIDEGAKPPTGGWDEYPEFVPYELNKRICPLCG